MASPEYYQNNKEHAKAKAREYYARNRERMLEMKRVQQKRYYEEKKGGLEFRLLQLVRGAKQRARIQGLPFDLDLEHIKSLWNEGKGHCVISGREFVLSPSDTYQNPDAPSLDKIIPENGYVKGNVRLVTWHVNAAILNFGLDTFLNLCKNVIQHNKDNSE